MATDGLTGASMATPSKRVPGTPVLQRCFIGAHGIARGAFMEEGRDRFFGFIGEPLCVFQAGR
jgi:hypothetical protein